MTLTIQRLSYYVALALGAFCNHAAAVTCLNGLDTAVPVSTPTSAFNIGTDGTLVDPRTGLMWMRCLLGQTLVAGRCTGTATTATWAEALTAAHALSFAGHADWRLPNPKEAASILEDRCANPALNADLFPIGDFNTWTATPVAGMLTGIYDNVWVVGSNGVMAQVSKNQTITFILVRKAP